MKVPGGALLALMLLFSPGAAAEQAGQAASAGSAGTGTASPGEPEIIRVRGRVRLVGSEPFPEILISDENGVDWYPEGREGRALLPYQQRIITVEGQADTLELILANGEYAGVRRILRNIRIQAESPE
jgi:hypothetical protein